ncbi:PREDICTED: mitochondrial basic amino acids transporter-like [Branchiostoma belcheri]|uniref:Mitochondrial basic amino acids transporter n=1 Tax=Branchiostoma belcheri TaxID=7741 RepID=A0A6P4Y0S1_BRABE|nr:PREDICTED: mitochondrial basic amino acids transporter-like [Branchiostoma belcheri]
MALDFVAGCFGGAAGVVVGHPFDTVKVRLQTQSTNKPLYRGTLHCFAEIVRKETAFGLFKGMTSPLIGLTFINAIVFGVHGNLLRTLGEGRLLNTFLAGAAAGAVQSVVCSPMELAKTRMQLMGLGEKKKKRKEIKNSLHCLLKIYRAEGLRGCYRGMFLTLWRDAPSFGAYFVTYDTVCQMLAPDGSDNNTGVGTLLFAGGMAGVSAWLITYPVDVMKSRIQADGVGGKSVYKGTSDCFVVSYKSEGLKFFTRGLNSTLIRAFPVNAATLTVATLVLRHVKTETLDLDNK